MRFCGLTTVLFLVRIIAIHSQIYYTLPPLDDKVAVTNYLSSAHTTDTPRGIFHYSNTENSFDSNFKIPDFEALDPMDVARELLNAAANAENRQKTITGINLPLPFAGKPLNFEMTSQSENEISLKGKKTTAQNENSELDLTAEAREAFIKVKETCLHSSTESCDEALDTFHRIRYGSSLMSPGSSHDTLEEDPSILVAKLFVPSLGDKLEALKKEVSSSQKSDEDLATSHEQSFTVTPILKSTLRNSRRHPFSNVKHPSSRSKSSRTKIRNFLERIT